MRLGATVRLIQAALLAAACLVSGCSSYPCVMFRENVLLPTPYMTVANNPEPRNWPGDRLTVTWIGHATVLINFYGTVILTDPVLGERLAPPECFGANWGIRRITELPCTFEAMGPVDVVLLSHAHQDHWDMPTLRRFDAKTRAIVPTGDSDLIPSGKFGQVTELAWGQKAKIGEIEIQAFQVSHWGKRYGAPDKPRGFNGYLISGHGHKVVFIGDTAYGDIVPAPTAAMSWAIAPADWAARIGAQRVDLCILPIGEYVYHANHMTPEEAWSIFGAVKGKNLLATHWRTFILSPRDLLPTFEPMERLRKAAGDKAGTIVCDEPGKVFTMPD